MQPVPMCPTCGSERVKTVRRTVTRQCRGQTYRVPNLTFHVCQDCGEHVYDSQAVRKIEACSPAYARRRLDPRSRKPVRREKPVAAKA